MLRVKRLNKKSEGYRTVLFHAEAALSCVIPSIMPRVPVYILDEAQFSYLFRNTRVEDNSTEYWGFYVHDFSPNEYGIYDTEGNLLFTKKDFPFTICNSIFLCEERIEKYIKSGSSKGISLENLMSKVLIHEFGHAYMDIFEPIGFTYADDPEYQQNEEAWANVFTLATIESNNSKIGDYRNEGTNEFLQNTKDIISNQPIEYALGGFLWECGIREYDYWAYNKDKKDIWKVWIEFAKTKFSPYYKSSTPIANADKVAMLVEWEQTKKKLCENRNKENV